MSKFYSKYNQDANSYSVFERGRTNDFGEPYCHVPMVTRDQAETAVGQLERGEPVDIMAAAKPEGGEPFQAGGAVDFSLDEFTY